MKMITGTMPLLGLSLFTKELRTGSPGSSAVVPPGPGGRRVTGSCLPPQLSLILVPPVAWEGFLGKPGQSWVLGEVQTQRGKPQTGDGHSSCLSPGNHVCPLCALIQDSQHRSGLQDSPRNLQNGCKPSEEGLYLSLKPRLGPQPRRTLPEQGGARWQQRWAAPIRKEKKLVFRAVSLKKKKGVGGSPSPELGWKLQRQEGSAVGYFGLHWLLGARLGSSVR